MAPLFAFNALCLLVGACFERTIGYRETHMGQTARQPEGAPTARFRREFRQGLKYLKGERGLLVITLYFTCSSFAGNAIGNLWLPYFRSNAARFAAWPVAATTLYAIVSNFSVAGRLAGGLAEFWPERAVILLFAALEVLAVACIMVPGRRAVGEIYDREV